MSRKITMPKCPYCEKEKEYREGDYDTSRLVSMATGTGGNDATIRCTRCGRDYKVSCNIKYYGTKVRNKESMIVPEQNCSLATIEDDIGKELKLLRKSKRITQEEMGIYLAKQLGKDKPIIKTQIYSYECGKNRITFPIFIGWCKVCDANPVEVLNRVVGK